MSNASRIIYQALPDTYTERTTREARYAAMSGHKGLVVRSMAVSGLVALTASLLLPYGALVKAIGAAVLTPVSVFVVPYTMVSVAAERRKDEMEEVLPDALLLVSANLKSGISIEKAFLMSARDEFGPLAEEFEKTAMQIFGGVPVAQSLTQMENRVKSELFSETLKLLVDGLESGGDTAALLESSADDIRNSLELQEEINSNIRMYVIFIVMAAVVGAPLLFSISVYMSQNTANMWNNVNLQELQDSQASSKLGFSFQKPDVDTAFFETFSLMAIIAINFFAGLIISEIKNANIKQGAKYIPVLITVSVVLFILIKSAIGGLVGGFV